MDIAKAAAEYASREWADGIESDVSKSSFIAGAEYRINSVWHNNDVMPECNEYCVIIDEDGESNYGCLYHDDFGQDYYFRTEGFDYTMGNIKKWAYAKDLFPSSEVKDNKELRTYPIDNSIPKSYQKI